MEAFLPLTQLPSEPKAAVGIGIGIGIGIGLVLAEPMVNAIACCRCPSQVG